MGERGRVMDGEHRVVYTLGTSNRTPDEFVGLIKNLGIETVVDVRRFPTSRFPHFVKEELARLLQEAEVGYVYLGEELGGYRRGKYQSHIHSEAFKKGLEQLEEAARERKTAILCAERLPWRCHRRFIGFELQQRGWRVNHVIDEKRSWVPRERGQGN